MKQRVLRKIPKRKLWERRKKIPATHQKNSLSSLMAADEEWRKVASKRIDERMRWWKELLLCWLARETNKMWPQFVFSHKKMCFVMKQASKRRRKKKIERRNYDEPHPEIAKKEDAQVSRKICQTKATKSCRGRTKCFNFSSTQSLKRL